MPMARLCSVPVDLVRALVVRVVHVPAVLRAPVAPVVPVVLEVLVPAPFLLALEWSPSSGDEVFELDLGLRSWAAIADCQVGRPVL